jgi:N-methylhydantoinase B
MFARWGLRPDSGGPGRHRGGLGAVYEIEVLEEDADVFLFGERGKFAPPGVVGGKAGALNRFAFPGGSPPMTSKMVGLHIKRGDRLRLESPGGGGYGDPRERTPDAVARDVRLGYVSADVARRDYGVAVKADGTVDAAETAVLRQKAAE